MRAKTSAALNRSELEEELRAIGRRRYHDRHPFHELLHNGQLGRGQVQAWALNRFYYQRSIPKKDAALISRADSAELRRVWRQRLADHDGDEPGHGGIARWLNLCAAVGLERRKVESLDGLLPATRFAVDAYVHFVREKSLLEAVASSLTELFAPDIIADRMRGMLAHYDFVSNEAMAYFDRRLTEAPRDVDFALEWVLERAETVEQQESVLDALRFKCDVLWAQLDALYHAYVDPGHIPPGAFAPQDESTDRPRRYR
ncbi:pyrroloquinoline-quinone synthase PqqC [Persicimonas caeni]|uniref:Pyrroloquinoline-quinone synthase n=1 Tax=Persicimonas caeni TaxID=2292766 RepID=A0A4Y6PXG4_PERCE|nr:pyrroloquinoline-quinone synthase PqqC [Persicimonas caeni]QDG53022.1 pyrroloquinoline-quinone synthase PqqC [Persicimonas caeni]QED34244.1 pyrroloquinoline-quinone synthase PqqC [Persicimonas caeni]